MNRKYNNYMGKIINGITIIADDAPIIHSDMIKRRAVLCKCKCGKEFTALLNKMMRGTVKSCGCNSKRKKHGLSGSKEYDIWIKMRSRCNDTKDPRYIHYGARGITVCDRWNNSFENFIADMGFRATKNLSLERKNNNKGYSPSNCIWATKKTQARNTRKTIKVKYKGKKVGLADLCEQLGKDLNLIYSRIHSGWELDTALYEPKKEIKQKISKETWVNINNLILKNIHVTKICEITGVSKSTVRNVSKSVYNYY